MTTKTETRATKQLLLTEIIERYPRMLQALREIVAEWDDGGYMRETFPNLPDTVGVTMAREILKVCK